MKLLFLTVFIPGVISHQLLLTNALPTATVTAKVGKEPCAGKGTNEDRLGVYLGTLQFGTIMFLSTMMNRSAEFCSKVPTFQYHIGQFGGDANLCVGKSEARMVNYAYQAVSESLSFLCKSGGQNIDILFSNQAKQCEKRLDKSLPALKSRMCIEDLYNIFSAKTVAKNICRTVKKTELCSKLILSEYCSEFNSLSSFHHDFFEAISKPCKRQTAHSIDSNDV